MIDPGLSGCGIETSSIPHKARPKMILCVCGGMAPALLLGYHLLAQSSQSPRPIIIQGPNLGDMNHPWPDRNTPGMDPVTARKRLQAINAERQKMMISDTNKLLKLARELSAETADEDSKIPSGQQMHKAAEIEKLAHDVKETMTYVVTGGPGDPDPSSRFN